MVLSWKCFPFWQAGRKLIAVCFSFKNLNPASHRWLTPVIPGTQEAEIRKVSVWGQPKQLLWETLYQKKPFTKKKAGRMAQALGPEFKPQYHTHTHTHTHTHKLTLWQLVERYKRDSVRMCKCSNFSRLPSLPFISKTKVVGLLLHSLQLPQPLLTPLRVPHVLLSSFSSALLETYLLPALSNWHP
jgi:hypothetical protein